MTPPNLKFLITYYFILEFTKACLVKTKNNSSRCYVCKYNYYSEQAQLGTEFNADSCEAQLNFNEHFFEKTVYISPNRSLDCLEPEENTGSLEKPYKCLVNGLIKESNFLMKYLNQSAGGRLNFKFMKGDHFVLERDFLENRYYNIFRRVNVTLAFSPLFCEDLYSDSNLCLPPRDHAIIIIKTEKFKFFISNMISITSLQFEGYDMVLTINNDACLNTLQRCCNEELFQKKDSKCSPTKAKITSSTNSNSLTYEELPRGLFNLESIIDAIPPTKPKLILTAVDMKGFFPVSINNENNQVSTSFVVSDLFQSDIIILNSTFQDFFLAQGIISQGSGLFFPLNN